MHKTARGIFAICLGLLLLAPGAARAQDLNTLLRKLDAAAAKFHSTSADFKFDSIQTEPIPDTDVQTGKVYYDRKANAFKMGIHIETDNDKPAPKTIVVSGGVFKMYDQLLDQVTTSKKVSKYESYLVLGFGASGKDLEAKWHIKYLGSETLDHINVAKLELIAKDPEVLKIFPKVTIWVDPERGVSLKQVFDEGEGQSRTSTYSNIKVNQPLPVEAFTFKTDSKTQYITR